MENESGKRAERHIKSLIGVSCAIDVKRPGTLPRSDGKAKRVVDLRETAGQIDTNQCAVHILSGEYDWSGTAELGREAQEAIPGATWAEMKGVGHFPMSENPVAFVEYLTPILDRLRAG